MFSFRRICQLGVLALSLFTPILCIAQTAPGASPSSRTNEAAKGMPATPLTWTVTTAPSTVIEALPWQSLPNSSLDMLPSDAFVFPSRIPAAQVTIDKQTLIGTGVGMFLRDADSTLHLVPTLFGQSIYLAGQSEGMVWVQSLAGGMYALDPKTLAIAQTYPDVHGQCLAITPEGFWCLDTFELSKYFAKTRGINSGPAAYGITLYDRAGKAQRRYTGDGTALPKNSEIAWATVDDQFVWLATHVSHGPICGCGAHDYGPLGIYRIDRASGVIQTAAMDTDVELPLFLLPDRLVWVSMVHISGEQSPSQYAHVMQLNKQTMAATSLGRIALPSPAGTYTIAGENLWVFDKPDEKSPRIPSAVFSLKDCRRVPLHDAGDAPPQPTNTQFDFTDENAMQQLMAYSQKRTIVLGCDKQRAWLWQPISRTLYEVNDDGVVFAHDLSSLVPQTANLQSYTAKIMTGEVFVKFHAEQPDANLIACCHAGSADVQVASVSNRLSITAGNDQRVWMYDSKTSNTATMTTDGTVKSITSPLLADGFRSVAAIADDLYVFSRAGAFLRIDGVHGTVQDITSWQTAFPLQQRNAWHEALSMPRMAQSLSDGAIAMIFATNEEDLQTNDEMTLVFYTPSTDSWRAMPLKKSVLTNVKRGAELFFVDDTEHLIRVLSPTGLTPIGSLSLNADNYEIAGETSRYLYLSTAYGVIRILCSEVFPTRQ